MKNIFEWTIYLFGLFLIGTTAHELYHFIHCGGEFIAGIAWINKELIVGTTWCERPTPSGELVPTLIEAGIWIGGIFIKRKRNEFF